MLKNKRKAEEKQERSRELEKQLVKLLWPVLVEMKRRVDRRLVKTFLGLVIAIVMHRHRNNGLLLSELGGYLLGPEHCPAGTKRISNLVHNQRWEAGVIEEFLWQRGTQRVAELWEQGERPLVIWDESVLEKPESLQAERLCAVRSTKAVRLKRIKPGYFNPPGGRPIFVPGFHWLQVLVVGQKGRPTLAHMGWWTTCGEQQSQKRTEEQAVLAQIDELWGKEVLHIWDRGSHKPSCMALALCCAGPRITICSMSTSNSANRVKFPKANVPGATVCCGMPAAVVNARQALWLSLSSTLLTTSLSGWSLPDAKVNLPGTCSPPNPLIRPISPGRLCWLTLVAGRSK